ncbi:MAG: hypothetical protein FJ116_11050 [Deltaproteobacteria bacterium]|nr:hypothetical protein [Deltaproteobacteria bacterium]
MKAIKHSFFLFLCLLSLANCRRGGGGPMGDGPMGGGPAGQAGPCPKCKKRLQEQLARERLQAAPFAENVDPNINSLDGVPTLGGGLVRPENLLGQKRSSDIQSLDPSTHGENTLPQSGRPSNLN